ncbi:MAG: ABC-2 type transport system permease protein [Clostridium sp.]|jgi:ABC-2 type transport system permease protein
MLNLIMKDIVIQKKNLLFAFAYTIFLSIVFSSLKPSGLGLYVMGPIVTVYMLISYAVNYDDKNKSEIVFNSLPIRRDEIVISKYISTFVFLIIGISYSILIGFIEKITGAPLINRPVSLLDIGLVLPSVCIVASIFFPVYFKFGAIKMRIFTNIMLVLIVFLPVNVIIYANKNPNNILVQGFNHFMNNTSSFTLNSLAIIVGLIIFLLSLIISIRIYNNKEL